MPDAIDNSNEMTSPIENWKLKFKFKKNSDWK